MDVCEEACDVEKIKIFVGHGLEISQVAEKFQTSI